MPYEEFVQIYDVRWGQFSLRYIPFLETVLARHDLQPGAILDLACGTGTLIAALARRGSRIVGLDMSPHMLASARRNCASHPNVSFEVGDFRAFDLQTRFDLILCCFDSLNYLSHVDELSDVFRCVRAHLGSKGLFVFDVVNENHCRRVAGHSEQHVVNGIEYTDTTTYDPATKDQEITLAFPAGTEKHHRVPLEYDDVLAAATTNGLSVAEAFASLDMAPIELTSERLFFVLGAAEMS